MSVPRHASVAVAVGATCSLALAACAPSPAAALDQLLAPTTAADPLAPLLAAIALTAWSLLGWLLLVAAVSLAGRLPGRSGRVASVVGRRIAPSAVRRLVELALGITLGVTVIGTGPASASPTPPPVPTAAASLDWPTSLPKSPVVEPAAALDKPVPVVTAPAAVVVQPGDSLWRIAADHLPAQATDAQIAQAWPRWWSANRAAVGADPDLIHPGLALIPPAHS